LSEKLTADGRKSNALEKAGCGLMAGGLGAIFGSPADLSLIRMQVDSQLPKAEQRGYKNAADAMVKIVAADGFGGLFAYAPTARSPRSSPALPMVSVRRFACAWPTSVVPSLLHAPGGTFPPQGERWAALQRCTSFDRDF
jgi:hypothetical protein